MVNTNVPLNEQVIQVGKGKEEGRFRVGSIGTVMTNFVICEGVKVPLKPALVNELKTKMDELRAAYERVEVKVESKRASARGVRPAKPRKVVPVTYIGADQAKKLNAEAERLLVETGFQKESEEAWPKMVANLILEPLYGRLNVGISNSTPQKRATSVETIKAGDFDKAMQWLRRPEFKRHLVDVRRMRERILQATKADWKKLDELVVVLKTDLKDLRPMIAHMESEGHIKSQNLRTRGQPFVYRKSDTIPNHAH